MCEPREFHNPHVMRSLALRIYPYLLLIVL